MTRNGNFQRNLPFSSSLVERGTLLLNSVLRNSEMLHFPGATPLKGVLRDRFSLSLRTSVLSRGP